MAAVALMLGVVSVSLIHDVSAGGSTPSDSIVQQIVREFMGMPDLDLVVTPLADEPLPATQRTCRTADGTAIYAVDQERRIVVVASTPTYGQRADTVLDRGQSLQAASEFASARVEGFGALTLLSEKLEDHGEAGGRHYAFLWGERLGSQGALGLQRVAVSVDAASGAVVSFMQVPATKVTVDVEPKVGSDQALAIAAKDFGAPVVTSKAELDVWWLQNDRGRPQILRWLVTLESDLPVLPEAIGERYIPQHASYVIDAHTGDILEVAR